MVMLAPWLCYSHMGEPEVVPGSFEPPPKALNSVQTPACDLEKETQAFAGTLRQALQHAAMSLDPVIVLEMSPGPIIRHVTNKVQAEAGKNAETKNVYRRTSECVVFL